jgi:hypothetical protein
LAGVIWAGYDATHSSTVHRHWRNSDRLLSAALFALPSLTATFLALQFFLLLAPKGECLTFDRVRYLVDSSLMAFQPEYCMGVPHEVQQGQPWLLQRPILQGWLQVLLPLAVLIITVSAWRRWRQSRS